jgi:putative transposase
MSMSPFGVRRLNSAFTLGCGLISEAPLGSESAVEPAHSKDLDFISSVETILESSSDKAPWPHAPVHRLSEAGTYIVTTGTYLKRHFFRTNDRLKGLHGGLLKYAGKYEWRLEAWAVFSNHYHFIAHSPEDGAENLSRFLSHFHTKSSQWVNDLDDTPGRKVWHNFRDTRLTYEKSFLARLNYVHQNAVKHSLVDEAMKYP